VIPPPLATLARSVEGFFVAYIAGPILIVHPPRRDETPGLLPGVSPKHFHPSTKGVEHLKDYHKTPPVYTPPVLFSISPWVPQPLPDTDTWMLYRVEKRFDSEERCVCTTRHTLYRMMSKEAALQLADVFNAVAPHHPNQGA